ncbi:MAG: type II secretion system protein [Chthoniobacterales bacterium]
MKQSFLGFSLLELIVALALFGIVVMSLLEFFPVAFNLHRDKQLATGAVATAEAIFNTLQASVPCGILRTNGEDLRNQSNISLERNSIHDIGYNSSNEPVRLLTAKEAITSFSEKEIMSIAHIVVSQDEVFPNIAHVEVSISSPANKPERLRHHVVFCAMLSTFPHDED